MKIYKCMFCKYSNTDKYKMGLHYDTKHKSLIRQDMDGFKWFYFTLTKKDKGSCIICKNETEFNINTMKYSRFCNNPQCKQAYRELFKKRMIGKYGKIHLLNDPEKQKEMLANRKISGQYTWSDGSVKISYVGNNELDFLKKLDVMKWPSNDIIMPSPHIYTYEYNNIEHFYIPDAFLTSINTEIEIKDNRNLNINPESRAKDKIKDELMRSNINIVNYCLILNKDYTDFFELIKNYEWV